MLAGPGTRVRRWAREALGLGPILRFLASYKVPAGLEGKRGWMYVFGAATLTALLIQIVTGVALAFAYVPSPSQAHQSLRYITDELAFGSLLRALHFFGASAAVVLMLVHMSRVFLTGSYKFPRQVTWMSGVILLVLMLTMALTGQLLRWDENGLWTVVVAASFVARVPLIGSWLGELLLAGPDLGATTLTRFYALHVLLVPLGILATLGLHLWLVVQHGISEPPVAGRPVDPGTYQAWYQGQKERGVRYWPDSAWREAVVAFGVFAVIVTLAIALGPKGPGNPPDPTALSADPRPDWFLRWYYALLYLKPRALETWVMVYGPLAVLFGLLLLPLLFSKGERAPSRRPWAPGLVGVLAITFGALTYLGARVHWSPDYETRPLGARHLAGAAPRVAEGAALFHAKGCQYCHRVVGAGGRWGPDLTQSALRLSREEVVVRIVKGFGDMPSYREVLTDGELEAIVAFLEAAPGLPGGQGGGAGR